MSCVQEREERLKQKEWLRRIGSIQAHSSFLLRAMRRSDARSSRVRVCFFVRSRPCVLAAVSVCLFWHTCPACVLLPPQRLGSVQH